MGLLLKEENLANSLNGLCSRCEFPVELKKEWDGEKLYMIGECPDCGYNHHVEDPLPRVFS